MMYLCEISKRRKMAVQSRIMADLKVDTSICEASARCMPEHNFSGDGKPCQSSLSTRDRLKRLSDGEVEELSGSHLALIHGLHGATDHPVAVSPGFHYIYVHRERRRAGSTSISEERRVNEKVVRRTWPQDVTLDHPRKSLGIPMTPTTVLRSCPPPLWLPPRSLSSSSPIPRDTGRTQPALMVNPPFCCVVTAPVGAISPCNVSDPFPSLSGIV